MENPDVADNIALLVQHAGTVMSQTDTPRFPGFPELETFYNNELRRRVARDLDEIKQLENLTVDYVQNYVSPLPTNWPDLLESSSNDFLLIMHVSKTMLIKLGEYLEKRYPEYHDEIIEDGTISMKQAVVISIFWLAKNTGCISRISSFFNIDYRLVKRGIKRGLQLIASIREDILTFPDQEKMHENLLMMNILYSLKNVYGMIATKYLKTKNGNDIILVGALGPDAKFIEVAVKVSSSKDVQKVLEKDGKLTRSLESNRKRDRYLVTTEQLTSRTKSKLNILPAPRNSEDALHTHIDRAVEKSQGLMHILFQRFPRLEQMHIFLKDAFIAAIIMHNISIDTDDYLENPNP